MIEYVIDALHKEGHKESFVGLDALCKNLFL